MIPSSRLRALCAEVLAHPTVSFREHGLARFLAAHAEGHGLAVARDRFGNVHVLGSRRAGAGAWVLVAHMDHPGFVVEACRGRRASARWYGRVAERYFAGAPVRVHLPEGGSVAGRVRRAAPGARGRVERVSLELAARVPAGALGGWDLPACRISGGRIVTRAADDLIGCALLAALIESHASRGRRAPIRIVYTRAEEAGLVGATALARARAIDPASPIVSLETSREVPGARLGDGVVLRLGDRVASFDAPLLRVMQAAAERASARDARLRWTRALMDGGTCEASPFAAHGYRTGGLALPLRHYHNMGPRRIAAEIVALEDLRSALALLLELTASPPPRRWPAAAPRALFTEWLRPHAGHLRRTALSAEEAR